MRNLKHLNLSNSLITDDDLEALAGASTSPTRQEEQRHQLANLTHLLIDGCKACSANGLNKLRNLKALETVSFRGVLLQLDALTV